MARGTLTAMVAKRKEALSEILRLSCVSLSISIVKGTPVDTGSLRASWTPALNGMKAVNVDIVSGGARPNDVVRVANLMEPGDTYYLANGKPYAPTIEYGFSAQAPQGMVGVNVARWQQIVSGVARGI